MINMVFSPVRNLIRTTCNTHSLGHSPALRTKKLYKSETRYSTIINSVNVKLLSIAFLQASTPDNTESPLGFKQSL